MVVCIVKYINTNMGILTKVNGWVYISVYNLLMVSNIFWEFHPYSKLVHMIQFDERAYFSKGLKLNQHPAAWMQ